MFKRVPGTRDVLPQEASLWQKTEETCRKIFSLYNYREIRPPLIEEARLFDRSLGKTSEIIQKQMFLIKNKQDIYALRPEGTASIVRSYIENSLDKAGGFIKLYYMGPMFRLERPQKGRLRQFHHIGCEAIGSQDPFLDAEMVSLADSLLKGLSISNYKIKINSLGCAEDKKKLSSLLHKSLKGESGRLCEDCRRRFKVNVLRILDCKNEGCKEIVKKLDIRNACLCSGCKAHFTQVKGGLDSLNINYEVVPYLVRGLDYYTRTVFEISHENLGAQDALGAGGRYDSLVKELGGPDAGAMGFAFGVERLLLVTKSQSHKDTSKNLTYVITLGEKAKSEGAKILEDLRKNTIACDTDYENKSLKAAMRKANDSAAAYVLILGDNELERGVVTLKNMASGEQKEVKQEELISNLKLITMGQ